MNNKLKIGFLTQRMLLGYGVDLVVDQQARGLMDKGWNVTVFADEISEFYKDTPYKTIGLRRDLGVKPLMIDPGYSDACLAALKKEPVDFWIIQTPPYYSWKDNLAKPLILVDHGTPFGKFFHKKRGLLLDVETRLRYNRIFNHTTSYQKLAVISEFIRSQLPLPAQAEADILYNGVDHYSYATRNEAISVREKLGIKQDDCMMLCVSRIAFENDDQPYKGVHELIKIFLKLKRRNQRLKFVLAGRGQKKDEKRLTKLGIIPYFNVPRHEMPGLYHAADMFVSPSRWEGFNLPAAEAQFQSTPCLALDIGAHKEIIKDGCSGLIVKNYRQLSEAIETLAADPERLTMMGERAKVWIIRFGWYKNINRLEEMITETHRNYSTNPDHRPLFIRKPCKQRKCASDYLLSAKYIYHHFGLRELMYRSKVAMKNRLKNNDEEKN